MFNEILTGQTSLEDKPRAAESPYRMPAELPPTLVCTRCQQAFPATQAIGGMCRTCAPNADAVLAAMRGNQQVTYVDRLGQQRDRAFTVAVVSVLITIVCAIGWVVFRSQMRHQYVEDMQQQLHDDLQQQIDDGRFKTPGYAP